MTLKRTLCLAMAALLLTGCTAVPAIEPAPVPTLPASVGPHDAPIGDAGLNHDALVVMYLPSIDGQQLLTFYETLPLSYSQHPAEAVVRALLAHEGNSRVRSLGGGVTLALSGTDPVEVSGSVCTVNLSATALQLSQQDFFTICLSLSATLCELDGVRHVNVLVAGRPVPMDTAGYLPLGTLTAQTGQELPVLWEQLVARRTPVGENPTATPLTAVATLYFPLADGTGIAPETRRLTFAGQHPQQLAIGLIDALSTGAEELSGAAEMPSLTTLMTAQPEVTDLNSGGKRVTLRFTADVRSWMTAVGADPACCFAALVNTLTTFIPSLEQVCILMGDNALNSLRNAGHGGLLVTGGVHTRADYAGYLRARSTVYHADGDRLVRHAASLPYRSGRSPRELLLALANAPEDSAVLPAGLTDADILGLAVTGDTLLINLSDRYADAIRHSGMDQRRMAYAIVNTMCDGLRIRRVRFFFGSESVDLLDGDVVWSGEFLYNPGLIRQSTLEPDWRLDPI